MARIARLVFAGCPHLVVQHALPGTTAFRVDADRLDYLSALRESGLFDSVLLHAYALLDSGVMLLATPRRDADLGLFMKRVNRRFVSAVHRRHGGQGLLWRGRFQSAAFDPEQYLLTATAWVEQAPVRANLAAEALEWPWSSARHHAGRGGSPLIAESPGWWRSGNTPFEREARHQRHLQHMLPAAQVDVFDAAARGGRPLGPAAFVGELSVRAGLPLAPRPRGRPRAYLSVPV